MRVNGFLAVRLLVILAVTQGVAFVVQWVKPAAIVINQTALFGLVDHPIGIAFVVGLGILILFRMSHQAIGRQKEWGIILILAGGLSNVIDRFIWGGALDYLPFFSISTFNLADVAIIAGALLLAFYRQG